MSTRVKPGLNMRLLHLIFLLLFDGVGHIKADKDVWNVNEGTGIKVSFPFEYFGNRRIFCRNWCNRTEDMLVETSSDRNQNGRYTIEVDQSKDPFVLRVGISQLSITDSGQYWYGVEHWTEQIRAYSKFHKLLLQVNKAASNSNPVTTDPAPVMVHVVTSGIYVVTSSETSRTSTSSIEKTTAPKDSRSLLWLLLVPVVMVMASVLLLIWKKKKTQNLSTTEYVNAPVKSRQNKTESEVYENVDSHPGASYQDLSPERMNSNYFILDNYITVD